MHFHFAILINQINYFLDLNIIFNFAIVPDFTKLKLDLQLLDFERSGIISFTDCFIILFPSIFFDFLKTEDLQQ